MTVKPISVAPDGWVTRNGLLIGQIYHGQETGCPQWWRWRRADRYLAEVRTFASEREAINGLLKACEGWAEDGFAGFDPKNLHEPEGAVS